MDSALNRSTGLTSQELSEVFRHNPRAYMAVRGAVAEKHLEKVIATLYREGSIAGYRSAAGDLDKDFYLEIGGTLVSLECKNVEVIKTTTKDARDKYIKYLIERQLISEPPKDKLPQEYRESGLPRYEYSASQIQRPNLDGINDNDFISQFDASPITIDLQRTRNSTSGDVKRGRYYQVGEIDIIAACLFSRTTRWEFLYAKAADLDKHAFYTDRYSNKIKLNSDVWTSDLRGMLQSTTWSHACNVTGPPCGIDLFDFS